MGTPGTLTTVGLPALGMRLWAAAPVGRRGRELWPDQGRKWRWEETGKKGKRRWFTSPSWSLF